MSKKPVVYINTSAKSDLTYYIYKFKNGIAPLDINEYVNIEPYAILIESDEPHIPQDLKKYKPTVIDNEQNDYITISTPFDFIYSLASIRVNLDEKHFIVFTSRNNVIENITYYKNESAVHTINDQSETSKYIIVKSGSSFYIHKELIKDLNKITLDINVKRISFVDLNDAHGVTNPDYEEIEMIDRWILKPKRKEKGNIYTYSCIAMNTNGEYSLVSNSIAIMLHDEITVLRTKCYHCESYDSIQNNFVEYDDINSNKDIVLYKNDMYSREVPLINSHEIHFNDENINVYNIRTIIMPNIWSKDKNYLHYRKNRGYRFIQYLYADFSYEDYLFYKDGETNINIDMVKVYKKDVTNLTDDAAMKPITDSKSSDLIMTMVRVGGVYYNEVATSGDDKVMFFNKCGVKPVVSFDTTCLKGKKYNYTIYLYDEKKVRSKAIVKVK